MLVLFRHFCWLVALSLTACSSSFESYLPLSQGTWRYYQTTTKILDDTKHQRRLSAIVERTETDDGTVFILRQAPDRDAYLQLSEQGVFRLATRDRYTLNEQWETTPQKLLPTHPTVGDKWKVSSQLGLIESRTFARQDRLRNRVIPVELDYEISAKNAAVTVPAGTFENCLALRATGKVMVKTDRGNASAEVLVTREDWYAPGIGLVKSVRSEESESPFLKTGSYEQILIAFGKE